MTREFKILIVLLITSGIVFGVLGYLNFRPTQDDTDFEKIIVDDREFEEVIADLDTSEKLIDYLNENFTIEDRNNEEAYTPEEFFQEKKGEAQDFASFAGYILYENNFSSFIFVYQSQDESSNLKIHYLTSFRDIDAPKYIYFDRDGAHLVAYGWSYSELCEKEKSRISSKVIKYSILVPWAEGFETGELWKTKLEPKEWLELK